MPMKYTLLPILFGCCVTLGQAEDIRISESVGRTPTQQVALLKAHARYIKRLKSMRVSAWFVFPGSKLTLTVIQPYLTRLWAVLTKKTHPPLSSISNTLSLWRCLRLGFRCNACLCSLMVRLPSKIRSKWRCLKIEWLFEFGSKRQWLRKVISFLPKRVQLGY